MGFRSMGDIEQEAPNTVMCVTLYVVAALFVIMLVWALIGRLDIIASAEGRLVPQTFVKIVQPADAGIVQDILVKETERVQAGQVLLRMDTKLSEADTKVLQAEMANKTLQLRRIDAELAGVPLRRQPGDPVDLFVQIDAQYTSHRKNYTDNLSQEQQVRQKSQHDLAAGREVLIKLRQTVPMLKQQAEAYADMGKDGYVAALQVQDKQRDYLEREQDLRAQNSSVQSLQSAIVQSQKRLDQITSTYLSALQNERVEAELQLKKIQQEFTKQEHKTTFLELKAPQSGFVKDLAVHTSGTVVTPGTILLTLVPEDEPLIAEIQIKNDDVGFVHSSQKVKVKLVAYPFQKYGMLEGTVISLGADAQNAQNQPSAIASTDKSSAQATYKAMVSLDSKTLEAQGKKLKLVPGMQVMAEIHLGQRTVMEYLLSPVKKAWHESARER